MLIRNTADTSAGLYINLDKNDVKSPISPGLKKFFRLAPGETKDLFYTPSLNEDEFQVQFELRAVYDNKFKAQALSILKDYVDIYHVSQFGDRYKLNYNTHIAHNNRVFISFDIKNNSKGTFTIHCYNPVASGVEISIDLLNGGYRLLHLNESTADVIQPGQTAIYETYGEVGKYLYFDLKVCYGDTKVQFFENDYTKLKKGLASEYKTIKDNNTFKHYLKL